MTDIEERVAKIEHWIEKFENSIKTMNKKIARDMQQYEADKLADLQRRDSKIYSHFSGVTTIETQLNSIDYQLKMLRSEYLLGIAEIKELLKK